MKYLHTLLAGFLLFSISLEAFALNDSKPMSAIREPGKSYEEYLFKDPFYIRPERAESVEGLSRVFTEESFLHFLAEIPFHSHTESEMRHFYQWIRDLRFLNLSDRPDFKRRISWLYPDDGCYARAEMAIRKLKKSNFKGLKKIFVFGDLSVLTPNHRDGVVDWWFHVAPLVKVDGHFYVIDPSISPSKILDVREWIEKMHNSFSDVRISVCDESSYDPHSRCLEKDYISRHEVEAHQKSFLHREWYRVKELGYNPDQILGEDPPWGPVLENLGFQKLL